MISEKKFQSLPADVRKVLTELGAKQTKEACRSVEADVKPDMEKLKAAGVTFVTLPEADRAAVNRALAPVADEWASELDGRGKPGGPALQAFRSALKAGNSESVVPAPSSTTPRVRCFPSLDSASMVHRLSRP